MKILQIIYESPGSPFGFGGAGVRAYEIYKRLKDRHDITLLCMKYPGAENGEREGLKHVFVGMESRNLTKSVLAYTIKAAQFIRKHANDFDVIAENFLPSTPFFSKFLTRKPVVLQVQGIMEKHSLKKFSLLYSVPMYGVEQFYPGLYDRFIFVSEVTKKKIMERVKRKVTSCHVIPNGIGEELLSIIPEENTELKLVLAGYAFDQIDALLSEVPASIRERIQYAGFVSGEEKMNLLSNAKLFVLPSRHESAPISILEAAACAKPVIVSDIPELCFVEKAGFGLSFSSGSVGELTQKMDFLLGNFAARSNMARKGREYAGQFLWDRIAGQFEEVLQQVVNA
jgi:glycosyltransferase involved in cell wall biosynthesis